MAKGSSLPGTISHGQGQGTMGQQQQQQQQVDQFLDDFIGTPEFVNSGVASEQPQQMPGTQQQEQQSFHHQQLFMHQQQQQQQQVPQGPPSGGVYPQVYDVLKIEFKLDQFDKSSLVLVDASSIKFKDNIFLRKCLVNIFFSRTSLQP
jgi:hypothetical protein